MCCLLARYPYRTSMIFLLGSIISCVNTDPPTSGYINIQPFPYYFTRSILRESVVPAADILQM